MKLHSDLKPGRPTCIYTFSGSASLLALSVFMCDRKQSYGGHLGFIKFNKSFFFQRNALKPGIYRFASSVSLLALCVFLCFPKRGDGDHLDFICFNKSFLFSVKCLDNWYKIHVV